MPIDEFTHLDQLDGFIDPHELRWLYRVAASVPVGGNIVELGSYRGKSTMALALGARASGAVVYAIDSHHEYIQGETDFGPADNLVFVSTLASYQVADIVRVINFRAEEFVKAWSAPIDLLFIDASHTYEEIKRDFNCWSPYSHVIMVHDSGGRWPEVTRFLNGLLVAGKWRLVERVEATSMLVRV